MICIIVSFVTVDTYVYISLFTTTLKKDVGNTLEFWQNQ